MAVRRRVGPAGADVSVLESVSGGGGAQGATSDCLRCPLRTAFLLVQVLISSGPLAAGSSEDIQSFLPVRLSQHGFRRAARIRAV